MVLIGLWILNGSKIGVFSLYPKTGTWAIGRSHKAVGHYDEWHYANHSQLECLNNLYFNVIFAELFDKPVKIRI